MNPVGKAVVRPEMPGVLTAGQRLRVCGSDLRCGGSWELAGGWRERMYDPTVTKHNQTRKYVGWYQNVGLTQQCFFLCVFLWGKYVLTLACHIGMMYDCLRYDEGHACFTTRNG